MLAVYVYIAFSVLVFLGMFAIDFAPREHGKAAAVRKRFFPRTLVIVPCRGVDRGMEENLKSIGWQDYPNYEVVAVVDSKSDPASQCISKAGMRAIHSGYRGGKSSGKVFAILFAIRKFRDFDVYVIADSDIRVEKNWLANLVAPLASSAVGVSTSFPKFVPEGGAWSKVKMLWGFAGQGMMESRRTRFGWGGSLAFRKELMDREAIRILSSSKYAVSDDISITKAARGRGLGIAYVKDAQPQVHSADDLRTFAEWSTRQTALSILGYRNNLYFGIAFYSAEILLMASGIALSYAISPVFVLMLVHLAKSEWKTMERAGSLDPAIALMVPAMPFIYLINLAAAARMKKITWRGRSYSLRS